MVPAQLTILAVVNILEVDLDRVLQRIHAMETMQAEAYRRVLEQIHVVEITLAREVIHALAWGRVLAITPVVAETLVQETTLVAKRTAVLATTVVIRTIRVLNCHSFCI